MSTALFNPPTPKNWIYIILVTVCLLIIVLLNGCKSRKLEQDSSKLSDKTEQGSTVIKKDSSNNVSKKTENIDITTKSVQSDSGLVITEKTKTTLFDSIGKVKSIFETVKITDKKGVTKTAVVSKKEITQSNNSQIRMTVSDSIGQLNKDVTLNQSNKKLDAKKESSIGWMIFGILLVLVAGFAIWKFR